ncbi:class I SAM-dependent methyltransferase [Mycobacterium pyrenivorans]|nr:class I SAM-dependent methyltransferase [Mycolicibacterium pyrenivorans]MCV7155392.1 class I SAM-dependent methyltransferase [Mycolicibacterium pyrenivorans]
MASRRAEGLVLQRHGDGGQAVVAFGLDDVRYLRSDAGRLALDEVARHRLAGPTLIADIASARAQFGERSAVLVETVMLRRKAAAKFADAAGWLFTDEALQQATAGPVAEHRAQRLAGAVVHDATCSIGTELAALRNRAAYVVGSDLDPVRLAMARHNVPDVPLCRADALRPVTADAVVVVDPARRSGSRRRFDPRAYLPPLDELLEVLRDRDHVVKCAPGVDFGVLGELGFEGEVEITSLAGSVREACLWSRRFTEALVRRRATMLDTAEQVTDADPDDCPVAAAGRWIVDPDGAVVRAGLVRHYAARHGMWQLDADIAYLSGDRLPDGVRGFEVLDQVAFSERHLRQALSARGVGAVEILVRGVDVDPDALRSRLRLRGSAHLSVVITRLGSGAASRVTAFLCRPSR